MLLLMVLIFKNEFMKRKNLYGILAALAIFIGFGMIHSGDVLRENIASVLMGIGSLYFMIIIYLSIRKDKSEKEK